MCLVEESSARLNDLEWLTFRGNSSVTLAKTQTTIREQNTAISINHGLFSVSQAWIEAPPHFKLQDWGGQEFFKADIYNPNGSGMNLGVKFTDTSNQTYYKRVALQPGKWNTIQISIADLASGAASTPGEGTSMALNVSSMKRVGIGFYHFDLNPSTGGRNYIDVSSLPFYIPLGSMRPITVDNVIPACKNIGTTHITNGCYRLHPVEWNIGEAAGALVSFCLYEERVPRQVRNDPESWSDFNAGWKWKK